MEISKFLIWYIYLFIFGIIGLPITNYLFKDWKDKGYGMSKFIGIFLVGLPLWFFSSIKIIPFNVVSVNLFFLIAFFISIYFIYKQKIKFNKYIILLEIMFFIILLTWSFIRATNSRVEGTEKFMNIAFMNSIDRSTYFPPADPWYQSETINYYYLGHYFITLISKLTGISISFAYNLGVVTVISAFFISLCSIFFEFSKKRKFIFSAIFSICVASIISFGGNLHYIFNLLKSYISGESFKYFFPEATRIIPYTINEFPSYSVVLADLHPHYLSIPFFIIAIALWIQGFKINNEIIKNYEFQIKSQNKEYFFRFNVYKRYIFNLIISLLIVALYGINSWDFVTINFLFLLLHLYQSFKLKDRISEKFIHFFISQITLLITGIIALTPYLLNFNPPVGGVGFVPTFYQKVIETPNVTYNKLDDIEPWLLMWGMFIIISVIFLILNLTKVIKTKFTNNFIISLLATFASLCLIIGVEFIFLKDIFYASNPPYFRTNTVFKFYYHAWIIWGIALGYFVYKTFASTNRFNFIKIVFAQITIIILGISSFVYIFKAVDDFYTIFKDTPVDKVNTLNGNYYIFEQYPQDYSAIIWINNNIKGQPVILEAVGEAYTYYARISANTGLINVIGWPTHEWQWRNDNITPFERKEEVRQIYEGLSSQDIIPLIEKYEIEYIYVGVLERQSYTQLNEVAISEISEIVFEDGDSKIYRIKR